MKTILIILLLSLPSVGWTCTCMTLTKKEARKIIKRADYVVLGTAIENVHHHDSTRAEMNSNNYGIEVKFKVEKIIKGDLNSKYVYLNQFETSNCIQTFEFGEKYIIIGTRIQEFENLRPFNEADFDDNQIPETFMPPPPPPIGGPSINKMQCYNIEKELIDYWNQIAKKEIVLYTNQCSSFHAESTYGKYFIK